ncbi:DUF4411 family protein [Devosia sp. BK]|uniref:DUF4411 family protein n=1 Tax=Devosia sp. BK TaxID=2871706 RepID=UPI002939B441|nr:DUF4411 family protein [Devosia sp. BK]MDV3251989.1 DUF4411 family protein [Devosia sp. BK]
MIYLLDANVFIEAKNRYYAFDIVPAFWTWMDNVVAQNVRTITMVRDELMVKDDPLGEWMRDRKDADWVLPVDDEATQLAFAEIVVELGNSSYLQPGIDKFLSGADPWLIAKAKALGATIVTHEVADEHIRKRVPIPNLCGSRSIVCLNTFETMRDLQAKFEHHG